MTNLQRRLRKLEAVLIDPAGFVPRTQKWLEYWDRQFYLYISGQDDNALWYCPIEAFRAVIQYSDNPKSLVGKCAGDDC